MSNRYHGGEHISYKFSRFSNWLTEVQVKPSWECSTDQYQPAAEQLIGKYLLIKTRREVDVLCVMTRRSQGHKYFCPKCEVLLHQGSCFEIYTIHTLAILMPYHAWTVMHFVVFQVQIDLWFILILHTYPSVYRPKCAVWCFFRERNVISVIWA